MTQPQEDSRSTADLVEGVTSEGHPGAGRGWGEVRPKLVRDEGGVDEMKHVLLAQLRKRQGLTQKAVAKEMDVSQARVSAIEAGQVEATEVGTITKYISALGGRLRLVADFGDDQIMLG
jgi:DNA-binding XRE family transcriptional regulator